MLLKHCLFGRIPRRTEIGSRTTSKYSASPTAATMEQCNTKMFQGNFVGVAGCGWIKEVLNNGVSDSHNSRTRMGLCCMYVNPLSGLVCLFEYFKASFPWIRYAINN